MKSREILGHIDCPTCGTPEGMRITPDKNGEPFGYCEANCGQQMRIGGHPLRVAAFVKRHPWAGKIPVTVTDTVPVQNTSAKPQGEPGKPGPLQVGEPVTAAPETPVTVTEKPPEKTPPAAPVKRSAMDDALAILGVKS